jgi:hypothetical protein
MVVVSAGDVRVGEAERERSARLLRDHWAAGRLDVDDLDARIEAVYSAKTQRELEAVTGDLPLGVGALAVGQARLWWPGIAVFHVERHVDASPAPTYDDLLRVVVPRMVMAGFDLQADVPPRRLDFGAAGGLRVGVLLHPASDGGTVIAAFGRAPRNVRKAFATLRD